MDFPVTQKLLFSCSVVFDSLWSHGLQLPGLPVPHHLPELAQGCISKILSEIYCLCHQTLRVPGIFPSGTNVDDNDSWRYRCSWSWWRLSGWGMWWRRWHPLQCSCLENPTDGGAWWAAVHGVAKSRMRLRDFTFTFHFQALEKERATHSSVLAWRIPGTGEPGGLPSLGSHRVGHDWSDLAAAAAAMWWNQGQILNYSKLFFVLHRNTQLLGLFMWKSLWLIHQMEFYNKGW